jgi:outer membrane lipoprotein SlyB
MEKLVVGSFKDNDAAGEAVAELKQQGYTDRITVVTKEFEEDEIDTETHKVKTEIPESAGVGAAVGGALGALGVAIAGFAGFVIPGVNILVAGVLGAALVGATVGGVAGALVQWGINESEAKDLEKRINLGETLVGVQTEDDKVAEVEATMRKHGTIALTTEVEA